MWRLAKVETVQMVDFRAIGLVAHHQLPSLPAAETFILVFHLVLEQLALFLFLLSLLVFLLVKSS